MDILLNLVFYIFIGCITKNAPCYSKSNYTGLQFCNHDTIKIHFQTVEKQQAKDKQLSFKTNTHSLLWIKLIHTVRVHIRILGLINMSSVLCSWAQFHHTPQHYYLHIGTNVFCGLYWFMTLLSCIAWSIEQSILCHWRKQDYHCNYTSELHRHLSEENLNAKYPYPHPSIEINTKCYTLHYNTSMSASVHCKRYILYIQCFRNQIYSHLHVTGFFTATTAILLIVSYGIYQNKILSASSKNSVCQVLRPRSDPSHSYNDFIYDTASFRNDRPALGFCW